MGQRTDVKSPAILLPLAVCYESLWSPSIPELIFMGSINVWPEASADGWAREGSWKAGAQAPIGSSFLCYFGQSYFGLCYFGYFSPTFLPQHLHPPFPSWIFTINVSLLSAPAALAHQIHLCSTCPSMLSMPPMSGRNSKKGEDDVLARSGKRSVAFLFFSHDTVGENGLAILTCPHTPQLPGARPRFSADSAISTSGPDLSSPLLFWTKMDNSHSFN